MSDKVVVMADGEIQQVGIPEEIYNEPKNVFVADFIGESNLFNGNMVGKKVVKMLGKEFKCLDDFALNELVEVVVRPEDVILGKAGKGKADGEIVAKVFKGVHYEYVINSGKNEIIAKSTVNFPEGPVSVDIKPEGIHVMKKPDLQNIFTNCEIQNDNSVELANGYVDVDLTQLVKDSKMDEDGYLVVKDKKYDLKGAKLTLEIPKEKVELSDDLEASSVTGTVCNPIYKGDHWAVLVRTEDNDAFILDTPYTYNEGDQVAVILKKEDIKARLKGDIDEYEI